jgi:hypothetical protein
MIKKHLLIRLESLIIRESTVLIGESSILGGEDNITLTKALLIDDIGLGELLGLNVTRVLLDDSSGREDLGLLNNDVMVDRLDDNILDRLVHGVARFIVTILQSFADSSFKEEAPANTEHDKKQAQVEEIVVKDEGKVCSHGVQGLVDSGVGAAGAGQVSEETLGSKGGEKSIQLEGKLGDLDDQVEHSSASSHTLSHVHEGARGEPLISVVHGVAEHDGEDDTHEDTSNDGGEAEPALDASETLHLVTVVDDLTHPVTAVDVPRDVVS